MAVCGSMATTVLAVAVTETALKGCVRSRMSTRREECPTVPFLTHFVERDDRVGSNIPDTTNCRFSRDLDAGDLTISQQAFAENPAARFSVSSGRNKPLSTGLKLEEFDENEPVGD